MTLERWDALRSREIEDELGRAHQLIFEKLPKRTRTILAMPDTERKKLIRDRKKALEGREGGVRSKRQKADKASSASAKRTKNASAKKK